MTTDGSPIAEVFPPDSVEARFVVSMSMAKNDVERTFRDAVDANEGGRPDFTYRVRLLLAHLTEALAAFDGYTSSEPRVSRLVARMPASAAADLKLVRGTLQQVGGGALKTARNYTFHYPWPDPKATPNPDDQLRATLAAMSARPASLHKDYGQRHVTLAFADDVALALALGRHASPGPELQAQFDRTSDGAGAFVRWAFALVQTYFDATGVTQGEDQPVGP